jgi:hypothetical protein
MHTASQNFLRRYGMGPVADQDDLDNSEEEVRITDEEASFVPRRKRKCEVF